MLLEDYGLIGDLQAAALVGRGSEVDSRIERRLWPRWRAIVDDDGLAGDEGQFLACSFWLVSALALNGRGDDARSLFERIVALANDLGLLAEEYDGGRRRQVGTFPQAFSHLTLILAARAIAAAEANARSTELDRGD